ncbi:GNAT family N-acetyltransferase [Staphylococcus pasteuri]|nr:GNAT family N-acetyltransferase [Staphylococcus pasteuri]MCD9067648.1 GNAT family N-acetyltransferase [Staphylococcus pasteuri]MCE3022370.1 GNAT family N-acetyltransferase [Staphylococcus pasteuri]MCO0861304.1 GNAT family N-acetyltransferase [Staphylococcus pasteuri]MCO5360410.1 GNAT family N-acetyltransferase [Staphylococcus pasteuri]MCT1926572.1 GNAT family N-acetyltransferase [Staphylococcus pasteuri]
MMRQIEEINIEDVKALQKIAIDTFYETFKPYYTEENLQKFFEDAYNIEKLKTELNNPESFHYFFKENNEIVGYTKFNIDNAQTEPHGEDYLEVQRIYFYQTHQGGGRGKELINLAVEKAKSFGKSKIWLGVWEHNPNAIQFYKSRGFVQTGQHEFYTGDVVDRDIIMEKEL